MIHYGTLQKSPDINFINFGYDYLTNSQSLQDKFLMLTNRAWVLGLDNYTVFRDGNRIIDEGEPVRMSFFS